MTDIQTRTRFWVFGGFPPPPPPEIGEGVNLEKRKKILQNKCSDKRVKQISNQLTNIQTRMRLGGSGRLSLMRLWRMWISINKYKNSKVSAIASAYTKFRIIRPTYRYQPDFRVLRGLPPHLPEMWGRESFEKGTKVRQKQQMCTPNFKSNDQHSDKKKFWVFVGVSPLNWREGWILLTGLNSCKVSTIMSEYTNFQLNGPTFRQKPELGVSGRWWRKFVNKFPRLPKECAKKHINEISSWTSEKWRREIGGTERRGGVSLPRGR